MGNELSFEDLESFIEKHKVFYIRHDMDTTEQIYSRLISEGLIAVHYGGELKDNVDATNPKNRENPDNFKDNARHVLTRFKECCKEGAIVFADYSDPPVKSIQERANIGIILEGSNYEAVPYSGHPEYPEGLIYEQAKLQYHKTLAYADILPFLAIHPRGGTLVHWRQAEKVIKFIYKKELGLITGPKDVTFEILFPAQQEVLCSEFLRTRAPKELRINYLLLPVGRGMKTIDIDGANERVHLLAQVSFSKMESEVEAKIIGIANLAKVHKGPKEIVQVYFGPNEMRDVVARINSDIRFFSFEEVFTEMSNTGILDDMLGLKTGTSF